MNLLQHTHPSTHTQYTHPHTYHTHTHTYTHTTHTHDTHKHNTHTHTTHTTPTNTIHTRTCHTQTHDTHPHTHTHTQSLETAFSSRFQDFPLFLSDSRIPGPVQAWNSSIQIFRILTGSQEVCEPCVQPHVQRMGGDGLERERERKRERESQY